MRGIFFLLAVCVCSFPLRAQEEEPADFSNVDVFITNETAINSEALEYSPAFFEDGIVFISTKSAGAKYNIKDQRANQNIMSIFIARRNSEGLLMKPVPFSEDLLTKTNDGPITFDRTNDRIFFTRNNVVNGKKIKANDGYVKLQIFSADKAGADQWTNIQSLPFNDDNYDSAHPSISVDGDMMVFASNRPGGMGGMDLYVAYKEGTGWGVPVNLGPEINTQGDDAFPFFHADGTIFFASNGRGGRGGLDVFFAPRQDDFWGAPINFEPVNSGKDDFGLIMDRDKKNGYFSSNRDGGLGEDDIYSYYILGDLDELTPQQEDVVKQELRVIVKDGDNGGFIDGASIQNMMLDEFTLAKAIIADNESDENLLLKVPFDEATKKGFTDDSGEYSLWVDPGNHILKVAKPGFQSKRVVVSTDDGRVEDSEGPQEVMVVLNAPSPDVAGAEGEEEEVIEAPEFLLGGDGIPARIEEGTVFRLPNIYYNFNDASIRPDARKDLDALSEFLNKYPDIEIELSSHTDSRGSSSYNYDLSQRRADNVVKYLMGKGISSRRMVPVGYGETALRNNCRDGVPCSESEHQYNRRTEVKILKMDRVINLKILDTYPPSRPELSYLNGNQARSDTYTPTSAARGDLKVVAGAFRNYNNAQARLDLLLQLGFSDAAIEFIESRNLHTVVAGTFNSRTEANAFVRRLKNSHGIESFVKR